MRGSTVFCLFLFRNSVNRRLLKSGAGAPIQRPRPEKNDCDERG